MQRDGDSWALAWQDHGVAMGLERLKERSEGIRAEVTVESKVAGRVVGPVDLNILSSESQTRFANVCAKRVNGLTSDMWHALVIQACSIVSKQFREPTPTLDLSAVEDAGPVAYLDQPSGARNGLIPKGETTVMYGDGESAKSLLALRIGFSMAVGHELPWGPSPSPASVLYLDWETNAATVASRLRRIALGELSTVPQIHYRQCFRSLADELPNVKEEISRRGIGLVIVDSIGFAASGALVDDETARSAMNALRNMAPATRLVVAHVSRAAAEAPGGKSKPFGSAFFWNGMRSGFEVRRAEEGSTDNAIELGVFHWKSNDGRHLKPFGLSVVFDTASEGILFERTDIDEVPELAAKTPLSQRIRNMLRKSALTTAELSKELDVKEGTVRTTLGRMEGVVRLESGGGRGKSSTWGLSA